MARLIPSIIQSNAMDMQKECIEFLEKELDDNYIIFQNLNLDNFFNNFILIIKDDTCIILHGGPNGYWLKEKAQWNLQSIDSIKEKRKSILKNNMTKIYFVIDILPEDSNQIIDENIFMISMENKKKFLAIIQNNLSPVKNMNVDYVNELIMNYFPEEEKWIPGQVSKIQKDARNEEKDFNVFSITEDDIKTLTEKNNIQKKTKVTSLDKYSPFIRYINDTLRILLGDNNEKIFLQNGVVEFKIVDLLSANGLLPALMVSVALRWAPVIAKSEKGGFCIHMKKDDDALFGYKVIGIELSSPLMFILPMIDIIKQSIVKDNGYHWDFDSIVEDFVLWAKDSNNLNENIENIEFRSMLWDSDSDE